jgi:molybdopterin converting factor small subunit
MKVRLRFFGTLALKHGTELELELRNGITWGEAVDYVFEKYNLGKIEHKKGASLMAPGYMLLYLNGRERPPEWVLGEGDEIVFAHPLVGG